MSKYLQLHQFRIAFHLNSSLFVISLVVNAAVVGVVKHLHVRNLIRARSEAAKVEMNKVGRLFPLQQESFLINPNAPFSLLLNSFCCAFED